MKKDNFLESRFFGVISGLTEGLIVNVVFLLTCIPVITYGPAKTALYETSVKWVKKDSGGWKDYLKSFRANLKGSILPGIVILVLGVLVYLDFRIALANPGFRILSYILMVFFYLFKEQMFLFNARLRCTFGQLMQNSIKMVLKYPLRSFAGIILWMVPVIVLFDYPDWFIRIAVIWVFAYYSFSAWVMTKVMNKGYQEVFETIRYTDDSEKNDNVQ